MSKVGFDDWTTSTGATAEDVNGLPRVMAWPTLAAEAYQGLAGSIVRAIEPYSEADPVALLLHLLLAIGNLAGRTNIALVEKTSHAPNEFACLVGATAKGRKGQSWSTPGWLLGQLDPDWSRRRIRSGLSSGEGLIFHVRDPIVTRQPIKKAGRVVDYEDVTTDAGEADKRLFLIEPEFASVLARMSRESNSLSALLRQGWDDGHLSTLTRNSPLRATGAHVSIIAHVTREELLANLTSLEQCNGFANRFLFALVRRSKCLPKGEAVPDAVLLPLLDPLRQVVAYTETPRVVRRDPEAETMWEAIYPTLSEGEPGLTGAVLARAEAHVLRLSMIYAILDASALIRPEHLEAALAVWDYAETSVRRIFTGRLGLSTADTIWEALRRRGALTRTEISSLFHRNKLASEIDAALALLEERGRARRVSRPAGQGDGGRAAEVWEAVG